jgi:hypothetical protein
MCLRLVHPVRPIEEDRNYVKVDIAGLCFIIKWVYGQIRQAMPFRLPRVTNNSTHAMLWHEISGKVCMGVSAAARRALWRMVANYRELK